MKVKIGLALASKFIGLKSFFVKHLLHQQNIQMHLVKHDQDDATYFADELWLMQRGAVKPR